MFTSSEHVRRPPDQVAHAQPVNLGSSPQPLPSTHVSLNQNPSTAVSVGWSPSASKPSALDLAEDEEVKEYQFPSEEESLCV